MALFLAATLSGCALTRSGYTVAGRVASLGASHADKSGVTISLLGSGADPVTTGADGEFAFRSVPSGNYKLSAVLAGQVFTHSYTAYDGEKDCPEIVVYGGNISDLVLTGMDADKLTISMIQGSGPRSPLEGQHVDNIHGVITKITRQRQNGTYTVTQTDGSITPQWIETDGFYMESVGTDRDGNPDTSDGIFVCTHNHNFSDPKLLDTVPTDLAVGQVVSVSGTVDEILPVNRFGESTDYLSVTRIEDPTVFQVRNNGTIATATIPDGVLLGYGDKPSGLSAEEYRTIPWEDDSIYSLAKSIKVLESVEGMTVKVNNPVVTGSTYYNITPILADGGMKDGRANKDATGYGGMVLKENDFNAEILYCDYAPPTWKTFVTLPQTGDSLKNASGEAVLRGVIDYTIDGIYWISPLDSQGWNFTPVVGRNDKTKTSSVDTYRPWRIGKSADSQFVAPWSIVRKDDTTDTKLTVASYNIENYCLEEDSFSKYADIADIILYNLRAPDIITLIEMGDDKASTIIYENQSNAYAIPDGVTWAVKNFHAIIDSIKAKSAADILSFGGEIAYDFREIAPEENSDGGEPGTNIRVGYLFRRDRVQFLDRGIKTNTYDSSSGDASSWTVPGDPNGNPKLLELARSNTTVSGYTGQDGVTRPRLTQSPGRINASAFRGSRKPLAGEFTFLPTNKSVFVIANHFGSKSGDTPLYGVTQPPVFGSDAKRTEQARAVNAMVKTILGFDTKSRIVVTGDFNDFQFSITNRTLSGAASGVNVLWSPSEELLPATMQYSYLFRGNSQQIDHIYVSESLMGNIDRSGSGKNAVFIPHIDSIFCQNNHIETSDHDPIVVRLNMGGI
jgi:predicted extracellular nuclease